MQIIAAILYNFPITPPIKSRTLKPGETMWRELAGLKCSHDNLPYRRLGAGVVGLGKFPYLTDLIQSQVSSFESSTLWCRNITNDFKYMPICSHKENNASYTSCRVILYVLTTIISSCSVTTLRGDHRNAISWIFVLGPCQIFRVLWHNQSRCQGSSSR